MKRGAIEIQFNWVFVLIVGTIILLFFMRVTDQQKDVTESKIAIAVLTDLDTITAGAASSRDTAQEIEIPNVDMRLYADKDDCYRRYSIGRNTRRLENTFIFSPDRIEGRTLLTWTLDWSMPYRVTNLVFLTSPLVRYIIVDDLGTMAEKVHKMLSEDLRVDFFVELVDRSDIELGNVINLNNYKVRLVFFDDDPGGLDVSMFKGLRDADVTALNIIPRHSTGETGELFFYQKDGDRIKSSPENAEPSFYIKEETIYAALFSNDQYIYNCNMRAAFERLRFVTQLYHNRTVLLHQDYETVSACSTYYYHAAVEPNNPNTLNIRSIAAEASREFPRSVDMDDINRLYGYAYDHSPVIMANAGLKQLNDNVLYFSCPEIY